MPATALNSLTYTIALILITLSTSDGGCRCPMLHEFMWPELAIIGIERPTRVIW